MGNINRYTQILLTSLTRQKSVDIFAWGKDDELVYEIFRNLADMFIGGWTPLLQFTEYILDFSATHSQVAQKWLERGR